MKDNEFNLLIKAPFIGGILHTIIEYIGMINTNIDLTYFDFVGSFSIGFLITFISILLIQIWINM